MIFDKEQINELRAEIEREWLENIAPFWFRHAPDEERGGFRGFVSSDLRYDERAEKGIILNSRILWTFARAFEIYGDRDHRRMADRAFHYIDEKFFDNENGGVFWAVDHLGAPSDTKKRPYSQAFALYALSQYFAASGENKSFERAFELFETLETHCRDTRFDGYLETFERNWTLAEDLRLSEVDADEKKSMNTHLHVLEAYASLFRVSGDETVRARLRALIGIFLEKIIHPSGDFLQMFFDEDWTPKSRVASLGHDIEASWLLCEAAEVLGDAPLLKRVRKAALKMALAVRAKGLAADGSLLYEMENDSVLDAKRDWWVQAEAVVGLTNAFELSGDEDLLAAAFDVWDFIKAKVIDRRFGEWFWTIDDKGFPASDKPKISGWKCPYHNGRMCFEMRERLKKLSERG